jgi:hypothetical protein
MCASARLGSVDPARIRSVPAARRWPIRATAWTQHRDNPLPKARVVSVAWTSFSRPPMHPRAESQNSPQALEPNEPTLTSWRQSQHLVALELLLSSGRLPPYGAHTFTRAAESHRRLPFKRPIPISSNYGAGLVLRVRIMRPPDAQIDCHSRRATSGAIKSGPA